MTPTWRKILSPFSALGVAVVIFLVSCSGDDPMVPPNPFPVITSISPDHAMVDGGPLEITISGTGFITKSVTTWQGIRLATTHHDSTRLTATITQEFLANPATRPIRVANPVPGGGYSNPQLFRVLASSHVPVIESLDPQLILVGETPDISVHGSGFVASSVVQFNGEDRLTTFIFSGALQAEVLEEDVGQDGTISVAVLNPETAGGSSNALTLAVSTPNPVPALTSVSPDTIPADTFFGSPVTVTLGGSGFVTDSEVLVSDTAMPTAYISETELQMTLSRSFLTQTGTWDVVVRNPLPGGGDSAAIPLTVINNLPVIGEISPQSAATSPGPLTLTVEGRQFSRSSVVRWNGVDQPTEYVSYLELRAEIREPELSLPGEAEITVYNPPPAGGLTESRPFNVYTEIPLSTNNLLYDPHRHLIYASIPDGAATYAGSVVTLVPETCEVVNSFYLGGQPDELAISADGHYLYVALSGSALIKRLVLDTMSVDLTIFLGTGEDGTYYASKMVVLEDDRSTVAVLRSYYGSSHDYAGIGIYDNGVKRPNDVLGSYGADIIAPGGLPDRIFGFRYHADIAYIMAVDPNGVSLLEGIGDPSFDCRFELVYHDGNLYSGSGDVIDPVDATLIGSYPALGYLALAQSLNKVFFISPTLVQVCNMSTYDQIGSIGLDGLWGYARDLIYPGDDLLVFRATNETLVIMKHSLFGTPAQ